jgi:AmmeMemoRadiSam system protein A
MAHSDSSQETATETAATRDRPGTVLTAEQGRLLLALARDAISHALTAGARPTTTDAEEWLLRPAATFVSVTVAGALRGCVGSLEARRALGEDVRGNACVSAFGDRRFDSVRHHELALMGIEVSVLSPLEELPVRSEDEALELIRPGVDGLVLRVGQLRGTLLPKVWEALPDARQFLRMVKRKAGLPEGFWTAELKLQRYTVDVWAEPRAKEVDA